MVQSALREAADKEIWFDAVLVPSPTRVGEFVRAGDEVTVLASGSERRKLERALGTLTRNGNHTTRPSIGRGPERRRARTGRRARNRPHITDTLRVDPTTPGERSAPDGPSSLDATLGGLGVDDVGGSESVEALAGRQIPEPLLDTVWTREEAEVHKRGRLVIYLGAAPGVGKTFAMLQEGQRAEARGTDVVVGIVQTYGRPRTIEALEGLEVVPPRILSYRGSSFEEMDVEAVIARRPERVLIDELAHTNIPGSRRAKRWEDVLDVLAEGVTVDLHAERPAPREPERRGREGHRRAAAGNRARLAPRPGGPGRARRHVALRAAAPHGPRQRLSRSTEGRARAPQVLHDREPHGAPRAGADAGREPGRRRTSASLVEDRELPRRGSGSSSVCRGETPPRS